MAVPGDEIAPPLEGLHVLELASGIAGPYAGRLLAMLGATVVKVEGPGGDPARRKAVDDEPVDACSPLYVHLNAGKHNVAPDAVEPAWADVVIDDRVRSQLAGTALDPTRPTGPLLVSVTAFGVDAASAGTIDDDVLAQARSGIIGVQGDPGREPLRLAGWQAQYQAGVTAAVATLAGLRLPGARHIDVSWTACLMTGMELHYADGLCTGRRRHPVGPFPVTAFPGGALPCRDGHVVPGSFRDIDWEMQCLLCDLPDMLDDDRFRTRAARGRHVAEVWQRIEPWYAARTKEEIFRLTLETPWTVGKVMTGRDALADPHLSERGFLGPVDAPSGQYVAPVRPFRMPGLPVADQRVRATGESGGEAVLQHAPPRPVTRQPMDRVRLLEVTVAWAGPYVGNLLGALGMDVVKIEAVAPFEGYRVLRLHPDGDPDHLAHFKADNRWFEASPLHNAVNRNKQGLVVDLSKPEDVALFLGLVEDADAVLCNFTANVLPHFGLGWDELSAVNPRLVLVRMPAFGTVGPYHEAAGYGTVVEGMGGFGARFGYEDEGARISDLYWPDPVAGAHAAFAVLAGLERRDRTGLGCEIDLAHMEVMWSQLGEGIVVAAQRGTDIGRVGNREPGVARSGFVRAGDDRWVAVVGPEQIDDAVTEARHLSSAGLCAAVEARGGRAEVVNEVLDAAADARLVDRFEVVDHPVAGAVRQVRSPFVVDGVVTTTRRPAPLFDQHTDEILRDRLGYDPGRIAQLRADGIVGGTLPDPASLGL